MNSLVTIQEKIPICPECGAVMKLNNIYLEFMCFDCKAKYRIIDFGHNEREVICERRNYGRHKKDQ